MREQYEQYRLVWHRGGESDRAAVPLGNGDYAASFWGTREGMHFYLAKSDAYTELDRNDAWGSGAHVQLDVFLDKQEDVLVVSGRSDVPVTAKVSYQNWRTQRPAPEQESWASIWTRCTTR